MDDAQRNKLTNPISMVVSMRAELNNLSGRVGRAVAAWTQAVADQKDAKRKQALKARIKEIAELGKNAKAVIKDLDSLAADANNPKVLASCATAKVFRDTVAVKRLASSKAWDANAMRFSTDMLNIMGDRKEYPAWKDVDARITMQTITNFNEYYGKLRVAFAKV
jgi:ABC-type phosphate transport system auxiliary subunit